MNILINGSNLKVGGGIQVADSVCRELYKYPKHRFVVILPTAMKDCAKVVNQFPNVKVEIYDLPLSARIFFFGRDEWLDQVVYKEKIEAVITIFGPSRWIPKCLHISGFARAQCVLKDSPFWKMLDYKSRIKAWFKWRFMTRLFDNDANIYFTENSFISDKLKQIFPKKKVYTITNNYNQIYDHPDKWKKDFSLPEDFKGLTLLTITANYPHKNIRVIPSVLKYLKNIHPHLKVRFVLTLNRSDFGVLEEDVAKDIIFLGPVPLDSCPTLYDKCDAMFLPTLLECFSASYAEAMKMHKPILTSDLGFAHSLCGQAALYFDPTNAASIGDSIAKIASDDLLSQQLVKEGAKQLKKFNTYEERCRLLIKITENEYKQTYK